MKLGVASSGKETTSRVESVWTSSLVMGSQEKSFKQEHNTIRRGTVLRTFAGIIAAERPD